MRLFAFLFLLPLTLASVQYAVADQGTCSCDFATFHLTAENQGDTLYEEVLRLDSNASVFPSTLSVRLEPGEKRSYSFFGQAACGGPSKSRITLSDSKTSFFTSLSGKTCDGVLLSVTPAEQTACQNQHATFAVRLSNIGRSTQNVTLSTDLNPESYTLAQSASVPSLEDLTYILTVNTPTIPQRLPFKVFAQGNGFDQMQPAILQVNACEGIALEGPDRLTLSVNQSSGLSFTLRNLGLSRRIHVESFCPDFVTKTDHTLLVNATGSFGFSLNVTAAVPGTYACAVFATAEGESRSYSQTVRLDVEGAKKAGGLELLQKTDRIEQNLDAPVTFTLNNTGKRVTVNARLRLSGAQILTVSRNATVDQGKTADLTFTVRGQVLGRLNGSLLLNDTAYPVSLEVIPASLTVEGTTYSTPSGLRVDFTLTNYGNATRVELSTQPAAQGPPGFLDLPQNTQGRLSYVLNTTASALVLSMETNRGTFAVAQPLNNPRPLPQTGLLSFSTPVLAFAIAVLLALGLLYLLYRRSRA